MTPTLVRAADRAANDQSLSTPAVATVKTVATVVAANALHQQVMAAVARLPDAQRAVMLLVAVEGLSYKEAAEALDVPVGTVMSRLARARLTIGQTFGSASS